jgi:hypothetical protein
MRFADPDRCLYADTPELYLISICYTLNIAVYQVDPCNSHHYVLRQTSYGNKNNTERVVYLFLHGLHYQRIFTIDGSYSYIADGGDGDDGGGEESISIIDNNSSSNEKNTNHIEESNEPTVVSALLQNYGDDGGQESISIIDNNFSSNENNTSRIEESNEPTVVSALLQNHWLKNKPLEEYYQYAWRKYELALAQASVWFSLNVSLKNRLLERWKENLCIPNHLIDNWRDVLCVPEQFDDDDEEEDEEEEEEEEEEEDEEEEEEYEDEYEDENEVAVAVENEMSEPSQGNDYANFINTTLDDSMRATSHQSLLKKLKHPPANWTQSSVFQKIFKCDYGGFTISGTVDILSAIPGELSQVTISTYPGRSKQKTGHMLLVVSSPY